MAGFKELRLPTFEHAELFSRGVGDATDIVQKEMYVFEDRGGRSLALRPEGTASAVRAYLEGNLAGLEKVTRIFYIGSMFRAERPQAGRYREFEQIGFESFGDSSALADAELIALALSILQEFGLKDIGLRLNSIGCPVCRAPYREKLRSALEGLSDRLCEDCRKRTQNNPLRALDCKKCGALVQANAPAFDKCHECRAHQAALTALLESAGAGFILDDRIVRGLDYYTRTVYEFSSSRLGALNVIGGGGRYDGLVELLGGSSTPATGFALGVDRIVEARTAASPAAVPRFPCVFVAFAQGDALEWAFGIEFGLRLRRRGIPAIFGAARDSLKSQMRQASRCAARAAVVIGESERAAGQVMVKDLTSGIQESLTVDRAVEYIENLIQTSLKNPS